MTEGYSLSDVAAVTGRNNGWGNGMCGMEWLFALLLLPSITNGGLFGVNGRGEVVTESAMCNANNFTTLQNQVGRMSDQQAAIARQTDNAICNLGYETLNNFKSLEAILQSCCCNIEKAILENRYLAAQNTSAILQGQKDSTREIIDWLCNRENQNLRDENMKNYINSMFCGVPRFQPGTVYGSVPVNPFFGNWNNCGNCCGNGNI